MAENTTSKLKLSRRDFIKIAAVAGGVLAGGSLLHKIPRITGATVRDTRLLMGTVVDIVLIAKTKQQGQEAISAAYTEMNHLIHIFDYRNPDSELGQLNRDRAIAPASSELTAILQQAAYFGKLSNGAFDVTVQPILAAYRAGQPLTPDILALVDYRKLSVGNGRVELQIPGMQVTLDGIAKGRIVDGGTTVLKSLGFRNVLVEAGGDLVADGAGPEADTWKIGIANPRPADGKQWLTTLTVTDKAVATSGDYMDTFSNDYNLNHIINPHTGLSPTELCSVTVIADTLTEADALATTLMVLGVTDGLSLAERLPAIEAMLVTKNQEIRRTSGFPTA
jgi:thiamine biosynthesis lipoprotein